MRTLEQIEVSIENTQEEIRRVVEFAELTLTSKIDSELKREFTNRLNSELEWLYNIKAGEEQALSERDSEIEYAIEKEIVERNNGAEEK